MGRISHLRSVPWKCNTAIDSQSKVKRIGADTCLLIRVYKTLLEQVLMYCVALWDSFYDNFIRNAQVLQNDALEAIAERGRDESVSKWFTKFNLLKINTAQFLNQFQDC